MHIDHQTGRDAFVEELTRLLDLTEALDDHDLLAASRCRGWTVVDVCTHLHLGLQEMLLGIVSPTDRPATVDAASYWSSAPPANDDEASDTDHTQFVRALSTAYRRPTGCIRHLAVTGRILGQAAGRLPAANLDFQGHVIGSGDFFATWAVELAVHHLNLGLELIMEAPTPAAVRLTRQTVEELAGGPFPVGMTDTEVILVGTGRTPPPADAPTNASLAGLTIPAFG